MKFSQLSLMLVIVCVAFMVTPAQSGAICGDPRNKDCVGQYEGFQPHDLIFNTGRAKLGTGTRHESVEFYAVLLTSVPAAKPNGAKCNFVSEAQRKAAQKLFPANKVFASRNNCRSTVVGYLNTSDDYNFMAVYAGETKDEANALLTKAQKKYPSANIRKMQVILDFADE